MDNFIVSARKYRPATFATVVGQSAITNTLKNAIRNQQLAQAFLFTGPRGVGKTTCARIMAKTINCTAIREDGEACNECPSCLSFNKSSSFNIFELDAASNNSVDDIKTLVDQVRIPPHQGFKIYIIDEVHMLSQAAFNAFLKTLEEPPSYAKFILATTEKHKILPTILSRCQIFDFRRIGVDDIVHHLQYVAESENISAEPEALHIIAQKADGGLRDALSMFDQLVSFAGDTLTYKQVIENLNVLDYDYYFKIVKFILSGDISHTLLTINEIIDNGFEGQHFITGLGQHLRNLLVSKDSVTLQLLETTPSIKEQYYAQAGQCSVPFILQALEIINECDINYKTSNNKKLHVEISLMQLCKLAKPEGFTITGISKQQIATHETKPIAAAATEPTLSNIQSSGGGHAHTSKPSITEAPSDNSQSSNHKPAIEDQAGPASSTTGTKQSSVKPTSSAGTAAEANIGSKHKTIPSLSGINLGDVLSGQKTGKTENTIKEADEVPEESYGNEHISISEVLQIWPVMAKQLFDEWPLIQNTLLWQPPQLLDNNVISINIENPIQQDEIFRHKNTITTYLRKNLKNGSISIESKMIESASTTKRPYTDNEKFNYIADKAPILNVMKDQLGLELDM